MNRKFLFGVLFLLGVVLAVTGMTGVWRGSDATEPAPDESPADRSGRLQPTKSADNEGPVDFAKLVYHEPSVQALATEMNSIAKQLAGEQWLHEPWHKRRHRQDYHDYTAIWGTTRNRGGYISNTWPDRPLHAFRLIASPSVQVRNGQKVFRVMVIASWYPKEEEAWGAHLTYGSSLFERPRNLARDNFHILFKRQKPGEDQADFDLGLPGRGYHGKRTFGDLEYQFAVGKPTVQDRDFRPYVESAESMRDQALRVIDDLEQRLRVELPAGDAVRAVRDKNGPPSLRQPHHGEDFDPWIRPPFPKKYAPTEDELAAMLEQALQELEERRRIWRDNYQELYAAAETAFPLKRLLAVESAASE